MTRLSVARWTDVECGPGPVLVVPLGSLEQHGPHLPLATDSLAAAAVCERLHELRPDAALAPVLPLGASGEHCAFPGTLSIGTQALAGVLVELVRDAARTWPSVLVVNGHGGNATALGEAARTCAAEGRRLVVHHLRLPGADAHAGRTETSLLLHLAPESVDLALAAPGVTTPLPALLPRLVAEGVRSVSPSGVLGDPTGASATEGRVLFGRLVSAAVAAYDAAARSPRSRQAAAGAAVTRGDPAVGQAPRAPGNRTFGSNAPGRRPADALTSTPLP